MHSCSDAELKKRFFGVKGIFMLCHGGPKNVLRDLKHINKSKPPKKSGPRIPDRQAQIGPDQAPPDRAA